MTAHEIRPKQLRALLLLLVLVPLIPIALMVRFMSDALKGERMDAIERTQQLYGQVLESALRSAPELKGTPTERANRLYTHIEQIADPGVSIRIVDGKGRWLAGDQAPRGQPLAQEGAPSGLDGLVQLFLAGPDVLDDAVSGQRRIFIATGVLTTLAVLLIAATAAMAVSRQITLQELKNTSVATVAHELRTPLASMRMLVDTLREGRYRSEQQLREYLDLIAGENERLRRIAENFLTFSRLERGRHALDLAPGPAAIRRQACHWARSRRARCARLHLHARCPGFAAGDPRGRDALAQVLANLIDNALKYTGRRKNASPSGRAPRMARSRLHRGGQRARNRARPAPRDFPAVSPGGPAPLPHARGRRARPGHRASNREGARRRDHGCQRAGKRQRVHGEDSRRMSAQPTVLIVEDDPAMLRGLKDNFEFEGYKVVTATDGDAGLKAALGARPDLIILDVMLPKVNGYEVCRFIREEKLDDADHHAHGQGTGERHRPRPETRRG